MADPDIVNEDDRMDDEPYDDGQHQLSLPNRPQWQPLEDEGRDIYLNSDPHPFNVDTMTVKDPYSHAAGHEEPIVPEDEKPLLWHVHSDLPEHSLDRVPVRHQDHGSDVQMEQHKQNHDQDALYPGEPADSNMQPLPGQDLDMQQHSPFEDVPAVPKKSKKSKKKKKKVQAQQVQEDFTPAVAAPPQPFTDYPNGAESRAMPEQLVDEEQYGQMDYVQQQCYGQQHLQMDNDQRLYDQQQYPEANYGEQDQPEYLAPAGRLATPQQHQYADASSPHSQLNEDLQAAAWAPNEGLTPTEMCAPLGNRNPLPSFQPRPSTSLPHPRQLLNTPATATADRPNTTIGFGQNVTPQVPTFNIEDHSAIEPPSSDIEVEFQDLYRKVSRKASQKTTRLTAEKQSIQSELQQTISAKHALEDRVSTLQQEKESLAASVEQEKMKFNKFKATAEKLQMFVGGLTSDIKSLRQQADSYHTQSLRLADDTDGPLQQMRNHMEESKRLNSKVAQFCQASKAELSSAAARTADLEERLKERSGALAEEKKLRLELQGQLISVGQSNDAVQGKMKVNHDALLDKLYEIHATLEESDNREKVTEMLEKTAGAIQGLNSQQATSVDEVASVKTMLESLTESVSQSANDRGSEHEEKLAALQSRIKELEVELQSKTSEVTSLQEKLDNPAPTAPISDEQLEATRKEAIAFQAQKNAETENKLKKLRARPTKEEFLKLQEKLVDAQREVDTRQQDVDNFNVQLENEKRSAATAKGLADSRQQELDLLYSRHDNEKRELENKLGARPTDEEMASLKEKLSEAQRDANCRQQDIDSLNAQLENEKQALSTAQGLVESRRQELENVHEQHANEKRAFEDKLKARPSKEELSMSQEKLATAERLVNQKQDDVNALKTQLQKEREKFQRLESGLEQHKTDCDRAIAEEKDRCDKKVEALHQQLAQAQEDAQAKAAKEEEFRANVEKGWQEEQAKFEEERASLRKELEEARQKPPQVVYQVAQPAKEQHEDPPSPVVEESQQAGTLPAFASVKASGHRIPATKQSDANSSPFVEESQQRDTLPSFASVKARGQPTYVDTQKTFGRTSPVVEESQQDNTLPTFASVKARGQPTYADTQQAFDFLQDTITGEDKENDRFRYQKPVPAPNSSSKRASKRAETPKLQSSSPAFVSSQKRRVSITYGGGSSGHRRRLSQGKDSVKRKADVGQITEGYEDERRKRMKPAVAAHPPAPSRPHLRSQNLRAPTMPQSSRADMHNGVPPSSSQGSQRTRIGRSKTEKMNARFSEELSRNKGGQTAATARTRRK